MSVIDTHRPSSASGKLRRIFSNAQSQVGSRKRSAPTAITSPSIPGLGRELSISEIGQVAGKTGRYLRIFCERVCPSAKFKTIFVENNATVLQCVEKVVLQLNSEGDKVGDQHALFEVIGRLPVNSRAIDESGVVKDPGEVFSELNSRCLAPEENFLNVFSLTVPAPGLCRRIELRKNVRSTPTLLSSPIAHGNQRLGNSRITKSQLATSPMIAPQCPFLLLIKGSRPETDLIMHEFSSICSGKSGEMTMGSSENSDIRLYLSSEAKISQENTRIINEDAYIDSKSPIRFVAKNHPGSTKSKAIWLRVFSTHNAIQPENPITVILNWESLTECSSFPANKCLEPGDILRIEAANLLYVFIFKDSEMVPEHKLSLGFLTLPQLPPVGGKPPIGQNGSRSAARTARIDALVRKTSTTSNNDFGGSTNLPSLSSVDVVLGTLFPRTYSNRDDSKWSEIGGILPDVGAVAGCFAHLLRSVVKHAVDTIGPGGVSNFNEDEMLREIDRVLSVELEKLNKLASQHLIPAIWETTFCYYLAHYLSPGWLKHVVSVPRIRVSDRRSNGHVRSADRNSNSSAGDSPSGALSLPLQRPSRLQLTMGAASDTGETYNADIEYLPVITALRDKSAAESETAMNQAVQQSLHAGLRGVTRLCRLFGGPSSSDTSRQIREAQGALFDKLDWTGDAITQALTARNSHVESPSNAVPGVRLAQAEPYVGHDTSADRKPTTRSKLEMEGGDSSRESSSKQNDSSIIDSEEGDGTSPSGFSSTSLHNDDEIHSMQGEEEDTGFGSSTAGSSAKGAQQRIESVFFCRFLIGLSKRIIAEFVNNRELVINWETGTQVLNLAKALSKWMHNAGVQNYMEALQLLYDFAKLMATPRHELVNMSWRQLRLMRPNLTPPLLYFLLNNYEGGRAAREALNWSTNDENALRGDPLNSVNEYAKCWQEKGRLFTPLELQLTESTHRPPDLATLFNTVRVKIAIDSFDNALAERHQTFRWSTFLKTFPPPTLVQKDSGSVSSLGIRTNGTRLISQLPDLIRVKPQQDSSDSSDIRDFAELNAEITGSKTNVFDAFEFLYPTPSTEGPSRSILAGRSPYNHRRAAASELGGVRRTDLQRVVAVPGGGFRSRVGVYEIGASSPYMQGWGTTSVSRARNFTRRSDLHGISLSASNLNTSQSVDLCGKSREAQKIRDDWSEFKRSISRPATPSTIEPDAETLNGSLSIYPPAPLTQSAYNISTYPRRNRADSASYCTNWNLRNSQQSLVSTDLDRPIGSNITNVQLEKVANETYGLKLVEGHLTRFGQLGIYVKSITSDSPASRANIQLGDRIIAINGKDVTGMIFKETCDLLKDCISRVTLTIQRGLLDNPEDILFP